MSAGAGRRSDPHADPTRPVPRRRGDGRVAAPEPAVGPGGSTAEGRGVRSFRWNSSPRAGARSCGGWSRSTSRPASPSARRCSSSAPGMRVSSSTVRSRARRARGARAAHASAHVRRPHPDRERLPRLRRGARRRDRRAPRAARARRRRRSGRSSRRRSGARRRRCRRRRACSRSSRRPRSRRRRCGTSTCSSCSRAPSSSS